MTGICQRIVDNRQVAEELAHDAFLLAFAKMDQLHNPQCFEAWLISITTNVARRYMQRHHDPAMLSLSTLSEEELPQSCIGKGNGEYQDDRHARIWHPQDVPKPEEPLSTNA